MPLIPPPTTSTSPCASFFPEFDLFRSAGMSNNFLDNFSDVLNLDRLTVFQAQAAVRAVRDAVRTGCHQHLGPNVDSLLPSEVGKSFPLECLHPNPAATATATETVFPTLLH